MGRWALLVVVVVALGALALTLTLTQDSATAAPTKRQAQVTWTRYTWSPSGATPSPRQGAAGAYCDVLDAFVMHSGFSGATDTDFIQDLWAYSFSRGASTLRFRSCCRAPGCGTR